MLFSILYEFASYFYFVYWFAQEELKFLTHHFEKINTFCALTRI